MKSVVNVVIALIIVAVLWHVIEAVAFTVVHLLVSIAILATIVWIFSLVYRAISKEKVL